VHARKHSAFAAALISAFLAKNPSSIALRKQNRHRLSWGCAMAGAATTMVGYQNASLYKIDHPCRVSLVVSDNAAKTRRLIVENHVQ